MTGSNPRIQLGKSIRVDLVGSTRVCGSQRPAQIIRVGPRAFRLVWRDCDNAGRTRRPQGDPGRTGSDPPRHHRHRGLQHTRRQVEDDRPRVCAQAHLRRSLVGARAGRERLLAATAVLDATLDLEQRRVNSRVQRLRRTRNAAIHGGTLSGVACATIADFAAYFAHQALNATISCYQLIQSGLVSNFTTMKIITVWAEAEIATTRLSGAA